MKKRVLVFPYGSETGLEINRSLSFSKDFELFGASSQYSNHGKYVYKNYIQMNSYVDDFDFIDELNKVIVEHKIDFVFPAHDSVVLKLSEYKDDLRTMVICPSYETCKICRSKGKTYEIFNSKIAVPRIFEVSDEDIEYPVFLKPDIGQGSKGTYIGSSLDEIKFYKKLDNSLLALEYLPGKEYTIDCFTDRFSNLLFVGGRERKRIYSGISVDTLPVIDTKFNDIAQLINKTLNMRGVWFFQVKENKLGEYVLLEVGPRVAGSMGLYRNLGINLPLLSLYDRLDKELKIIENIVELEMDRALTSKFKLDFYYENVYVDLDDCLIFENNINPFVVAFLYQCINNKKKLFLLTKHEGNLIDYLEKYRIREIFDEIIQIEKGKEKRNYIINSKSIFIDDSFIERYYISRDLNIPTFDTNAIESLLDWRV